MYFINLISTYGIIITKLNADVTRGRKKTQVCDLRFGLPGCNFIFFSTSIAAIYTFSNEIIKLAAVCLFTGQLPPSTKERECFFLHRNRMLFSAVRVPTRLAAR
jgi:hypothetical protein